MNKTLVIHYKGGIIVLFLITILFTLTRTLILGLILTMGFAVLSGLFNQQKKVIFWFVFMFILTLPIIGARLLSSTDDINAAVSDKSVEQGSNMTFAYRIFHVTERYLYVSKDPKHEFFGIGFIHERDFPKDTFLLGHRNEKYEATQLEQDDVSWSNLFLRYGIFGTVLYMFIFVAFVVAFFKQKTNGINAAAIMFMIMTLILSFASGKFSQADYFLVPMFFFFYIRKSRQDAETKESNVLLSTSDVHKNS
ncbi:O-antigen ligase family protein [Pedobacter gandavensis]|nr:O-antigen ligase family protein [Pedobacter gandavensis]